MSALVKKQNKQNKRKWVILAAVVGAILAGLVVWLVVSIVNGNGFRPIPRTEEEARVVMTMDGEDVHYDLYRCLFRNYAATYTSAPTTAAEKEARFSAIHEKVVKDIASLYATFRAAEHFGADSDSAAYKDAYKTLLGLMRESGYFEGNYIQGYESHEEYLAALEENHMTDAVYRLYLERTAAEYAGTKAFQKNPSSFVTVSDEAMEAFFYSDDAVLVVSAFIDYANFGYNVEAARQSAELHYGALLACEDLDSYIRRVMQIPLYVSPSARYDIENGIFLTRYHPDNYRALSEAAFELSVGEMSNIIETPEGLYILRRLPVTEEKLDLLMTERKEALTDTYFAAAYYGKTASIAEDLLAKIAYTDAFSALTYDTVME